jgi:hypothetical protein
MQKALKKGLHFSIFTLLALCMSGMMAFAADSQPGSKATAKLGDIAVLNVDDYGPETILSQNIKGPGGKDLFINVSLECGLATDTDVKSKGGNRSTAVAEAGVWVWVEVDGEMAEPGAVQFCKRTQELTAKFDGLLSLCLIADPLCVEQCTDDVGNVDQPCVDECPLVIDSACEILPEEVGLFLDTMNANSFGFVYGDLDFSGVHTVEVKAQVATRTCSYAGETAPNPCVAVVPDVGTAQATGSIGKGSVTVELVRMIKGEDIELQ